MKKTMILITVVLSVVFSTFAQDLIPVYQTRVDPGAVIISNQISDLNAQILFNQIQAQIQAQQIQQQIRMQQERALNYPFFVPSLKP